MPFRLPLLFGLLILLAVTTALFWPPFEENPEVLKLYGHIELRDPARWPQLQHRLRHARLSKSHRGGGL